MTYKLVTSSRPFSVFTVIIIFLAATEGAWAASTLIMGPAATYPTGGQPVRQPGQSWLAVADLNGDGKLDVVAANWCVSYKNCTSSNVGVLLNKGDGTFKPVATYDTGGYHAFSVSVADLNNDGRPDLLVAIGCADEFQQTPPRLNGSVAVLLGNGDGSFKTVHNYPTGGSVTEIAIADLNGDGNVDLVASICGTSGQFCGSGEGIVGVLLGNGDGTFQTVQNYDSGGLVALSIRVADVNGDLKPDLLASNQTTCNRCTGNVGVLLGRGDGHFQSVQVYDAGIFSPTLRAVIDLNGDSKPDLVLSVYPFSGVAVLLNLGDGAFSGALVNFSTGGSYTGTLLVSDMNGDGNADLLLSNLYCPSIPVARGLLRGCVGIMLGNGDGTFQPAVSYDSGSVLASSLAVADFDGDGKLDVAVANLCNASGCLYGIATAGILLGNGNATFDRP